MKKIILLAAILSSLIVNAGTVERYFQRYQQQQQSKNSLKNTAIKTGYFDQLIDPENPELGTFKQRYYLDDAYAKKNNSPVFFYICGEAECTKRSLSGAIRFYAKQFNARLIALEHRFYGKSQPYNDLSTQHLSYLTIKNALADLAHFQRTITQKYGWTGKWVSFGGSYPGSLSAYYRMQYPYLVVGAIASSAPVRAQESYPEYDQHVSKIAGTDCANAMRRVVKEIEAIQSNKQKFNEVKRLFEAENVVHDVDFLYLVADIGAGAIQYGMHEKFCQMLTTQGNELEAYAGFAKYIYKLFGASAESMTAQAAETDELGDNAKEIGMRQWYYQSCREYGYWQVAHKDPEQSTRSAQIDLAYHHNICKRLFNLTTPATIEQTNQSFFTPMLNDITSHIVFTNGSNDPWSILSITPDSEWATNTNLIYELIEGKAHCDDLRSPSKSDSEALKEARKKELSAISDWLLLS